MLEAAAGGEDLLELGRRQGLTPLSEIRFKDGLPCWHPGCLQHRSHPCEVCGRIGGHYPKEKEIKDEQESEADTHCA